MRLIYLIILIIFSPTLWGVIEGSCEDISLLSNKDGDIEIEIYAATLNQKINFYDEKNNEIIDHSKRLGEHFFLKRKEQAWLKTEERGWVKTKDVLCGGKALLDKKTKLKLKAFPKPKAYKEGESKAVIFAYKNLDDAIKNTKNANIQSLSSFKYYYILAKYDKQCGKDNCVYYLLSEAALAEKNKLVGWVVKNDIILWNSVVAIRPDDNSNTKINIYHTNKGKHDNSGFVRGGKQWYTKSLRLPVLNMDRGYYKIASTGTFNNNDKELDLNAFNNNDKEIKDLVESFKYIDIFFLIDGTASMEPYITKVKQQITRIIEELKETYSESNFRLGFLVYRDKQNINANAIEQHLILSNSCNNFSNLDSFNQKLSNVKASPLNAGSYPEDLFLGLKNTYNLMNSCREHTKILFVMGNAGDHKRLENSKDEFGNKFKNELRKFIGFRLFSPFFIRTEVDCNYKNNPTSCKNAYDNFKTDAISFIELTRPDIKDPKTLDLEESELVSNIKNKLKIYAEREQVNKVGSRVRGGESISTAVKIIDDIQFRGKLKSILCAKLSGQCEKGIYHATTEAYIKIQDSTVEEVLMTYAQLQDWMALLRRVTSEYKKEQREEMVIKIKQHLNLMTSPPDNTIGMHETIAQFIKDTSSGLPLRKKSPFTQYTMNEIKETRCFSELKQWMEVHRIMLLNVINNPSQRSIFKETGAVCTDQWGKQIPEIRILGNQALGPDNSFTYQHEIVGENIYWVPIKYLP